MLPFGKNQDVIFRGPLVAARLLVIGCSLACREAGGRDENAQEERASCLIRSR
jgi:hypothetical protein